MIESAIKFSHKSGKKNEPNCIYILELTSKIRRTLVEQQRVFINWIYSAAYCTCN